MSKRIVSFVLALALMFSMVPTSVFAEEADTHTHDEVLTEQEQSNEGMLTVEEQLDVETLTEEMPAEQEELEAESLTSSEVSITNEELTLPVSGTCGENLTWTLDENGTLTISGKGKMDDWGGAYNFNDVPWHSYCSNVTTVIICDGISSIGRNSFRMCSNLTKVEISNTVTSVGSYAFQGCSSLLELFLTKQLILFQ